MKFNQKRLLEMIPGIITWSFIIFLVTLSVVNPVIVAYIVIFYTTYFIYESVTTAYLMYDASKRTRIVMKTNWLEKVKGEKNKYGKNWEEYYQAIIIPFANEGEETLVPTIEHLIENEYPKEKKIIVLATEERLEKGFLLAQELENKYKDKFFKILITRHRLEQGEIVGKASNQNWAARQLYKFIIENGMDTSKVIVSSNDADSRHIKWYMARLTYAYLNETEPEKRIYQPIPMFFNNIWDVPFISRILATLSAYWQMAISLKPHRYMNFSSYAICLETLHTIGYWDPDIIPEDERLFWRAVSYYGSELKMVPLFIPVFMDAVKASTYVKTLKEQYVQIRRWAWGASEISFSFPNIIRSKKIPTYLKIFYLFQQVRKSFEWAIAPLILMFGLSIPTLLNPHFSENILSNSVPFILSRVLTFTTIFSLVVFYIEAVFAPPKPTEWSILRKSFSIIQWITFPYVNILFSALPAIEAQTRLLFGKSIQYVPTEKAVSKPKK